MFWREAPENFANFRRRSQKIEPRAIFLQHLRGFSKKITSRPQKNDLELRGGLLILTVRYRIQWPRQYTYITLVWLFESQDEVRVTYFRPLNFFWGMAVF